MIYQMNTELNELFTPGSRLLISWSGGVESTSVLKYFLERTEFPIVSHFIVRISPENRNELEQKAVQTLEPLLKRIRPFETSISYVSLDSGSALPMDYEVEIPLSLLVARHRNCSNVLRGNCLEDNKRARYSPKEDFDSKVSLGQGFVFNRDIKQVIPYIHCLYDEPKRWHIRNLGELFQHTWSCRRPVSGEECGTCHSCLERNS
jgi:7-cyano-7-deazaguanine synthase in queuosine biosynthesis